MPIFQNAPAYIEQEVAARLRITTLLLTLRPLNMQEYLHFGDVERERRRAIEILHPDLQSLTQAFDAWAHAVPGTVEQEVEWLCSPQQRPVGDDSPQLINGVNEPLPQIADANPNSDDPSPFNEELD